MMELLGIPDTISTLRRSRHHAQAQAVQTYTRIPILDFGGLFQYVVGCAMENHYNTMFICSALSERLTFSKC